MRGLAPADVFGVVTDFPAYPRLFKEMKTVTVLSKDGNRQRVEFRLEMVIAIRYVLDLVCDAAAGTVDWTYVEGEVVTDPRIVDEEMRFEVLARRVTVSGAARAYRGRLRVFVRSPRPGPPDDGQRVRKGDLIRTWVEIRVPEPPRTPGGFAQRFLLMYCFHSERPRCRMELTVEPVPEQAVAALMDERGSPVARDACCYGAQRLSRSRV